MTKSSSVLELNPESATKPRAAKPRRRASVAPAVETLAAPNKSSVKPVLIGFGVGVAVAATALVVQSQLRGSRRGSSLAGTLAKAALIAVTRMVVQRAVNAAAEQAQLRLANVNWPSSS